MDKQEITARRGIAELALKGFFDIAQRWNLNRKEAMTLLGLTATSTYANWKNSKTGTLPRDTLERISYLLNIDDIVRHTSFGMDNILRTPLADLSQLSPLERMLQGDVVDIYIVRETVSSLETYDISTLTVTSNRLPNLTNHSP